MTEPSPRPSGRAAATSLARRRVVANHAFAVQADLDLLAWIVGLTLAALLRVDFEPGKLVWLGQVVVIPIVVLLHLLASAFTGLYDGRYRRGSFEEAIAVAVTVAAVTPVLFGVVLLASDTRMVPLSSVPGGGAIAVVVMSGVRSTVRMRSERRHRPTGDAVQRLLVVGAGTGAQQVIDALLHDPDGDLLPVAILDDDPDKRNLRLRGVPVVGTTDRVAETAAAVDASTVLVAIPSASREVLATVTRQANAVGLPVKVLPSVRDLIGGEVQAGDVRDLQPADLLGRHEIHTNVQEIAGYVRGRRLLVTGAGGSIGSELCRQLARFEPAELFMLDRDESALHAVQLSIQGRALLDGDDAILCDIRDRPALAEVFERCRPQVVFHAAALKHLPMLEGFPEEGWKTNVLGTENVLELAAAAGVERFVNVSTDKAADPSSVLGLTKRIAERLTAHRAEAADGTYLSVRFGNVLGSRGSVLDTFHGQIAAGGPVTVTHPDVTRYFMTIAEACELVIQAGAIGGDGEVLVLDMGAPVRIADLAQQLIVQSGRDVPIVYTGLRNGEKLHEQLFGDDEGGERPSHPLITHVTVSPLDPEVLGAAAEPPRARLERLVRMQLV